MRSRVAALCVLVAVVGATLTGCSSAGTPGGGEPSGSSMPSEGISSSGVVEPLPSEPAAPTVTPATGPEVVIPDLDVDVLRFRLPEGDWRLTSGGRSGSIDTGDGTTSIGGFTSTAGLKSELGHYAKIGLQSYRGQSPEPERIENRTIDGIEGYVLEGSGKDGLIYEYGTIYEESFLVLTFDFPQDTPTARAWIESVLAGAEWL